MTSSKISTLSLSPPRSDLWLGMSLRLLAASGVALLVVIVWCLFAEALGVFRDIGVLRFVTDGDWHPTEGSFNLTPMAVASVASALGAVLVATPVGIGMAIFAQFYTGERMGSAVRQLMGLFAGIPSVVFGFWGLTVLVPLISEYRPPGSSLLAGILILSMMILPTIALTSQAALRAVPLSHLAAGHALGLRRGTIVLKVALASAKGGIVAGVIMAVGRAIGETMAMLMVSGNIVQVPQSVFDSTRSLAANIALEMAYATGEHRSALYASGLVLIAVVAILTVISERLHRGGHHAH